MMYTILQSVDLYKNTGRERKTIFLFERFCQFYYFKLLTQQFTSPFQQSSSPFIAYFSACKTKQKQNQFRKNNNIHSIKNRSVGGRMSLVTNKYQYSYPDCWNVSKVSTRLFFFFVTCFLSIHWAAVHICQSYEKVMEQYYSLIIGGDNNHGKKFLYK